MCAGRHDASPELTPTREQARRFWAEFTARYDTRVFAKDEALEMRLAGRALEAARIMPARTFMEDYTTVWSRRVYPCFTPGEGDAEELWAQLVVCVHEHQHVEQVLRLGRFGMARRYVWSTRQRALLEAEAYCCNLELSWWRHGRLPDLVRLAEGLCAYGCDDADIEAARRVFVEAAAQLRRGEWVTEATRAAIPLLEQLGIIPLATLTPPATTPPPG